MSQFITLTRYDGTPITVNTANVLCVAPALAVYQPGNGQPSETYDGTVIMIGPDNGVVVREPWTFVAGIIDALNFRVPDLQPIPQEATA